MPSQPEVIQSLAFAVIVFFSFQTLKMITWKCYNWFDWCIALFSILTGSAIAYLI